MPKTKKKVRRLTPEQKVRLMLNLIDRFFVALPNARDGSGQQLWDVLSAIRGPDSQELRLKQLVTIPIRRAAFPQAAKAPMSRALMKPDFSLQVGQLDVDAITVALDGLGHFHSHARAAAKALGFTNVG